MNWFMSLEDARDKIERWRKDYNEFRTHSALTYLTPAEFALKTGSKPSEHRFFLIQSGLRFEGHLNTSILLFVLNISAVFIKLADGGHAGSLFLELQVKAALLRIVAAVSPVKPDAKMRL